MVARVAGSLAHRLAELERRVTHVDEGSDAAARAARLAAMTDEEFLAEVNRFAAAAGVEPLADLHEDSPGLNQLFDWLHQRARCRTCAPLPPLARCPTCRAADGGAGDWRPPAPSDGSRMALPSIGGTLTATSEAQCTPSPPT